MTAYYNENNALAAAWLRELIANHHIAPGHVDERSIADVRATDLAGFTQCHFFAGIGVWSAALRGAGWADDRSVWTGSCPCQPFSGAGKGDGFNDPRHLWPNFFALIEECRPDVVFGEQVASKDGLAWLDLVHADLEGAGYAVGAADLCAAGIGAPHIRQRLYWVADRDGAGLEGYGRPVEQHGAEGWPASPRHGAAGGVPLILGDASRGGRGVGGDAALARSCRHADGSGLAIRLADSHGRRSQVGWSQDPRGDREGASRESTDTAIGHPATEHLPSVERPGPTNGHWSAADWIYCRDGKWRPVEPGTFPLAHGALERVGRLRGYGNAIVLPLATAFVEAFLEAKDMLPGAA